MSQRERLPDRREADTQVIQHILPDGNGQELTITIGRFPDGRIGEVFVELPYDKQKHMTALLGKDVATLISIALQHGTPVQELAAAMGRSEVNWMGMMVERPHTLLGTVLDALVAAG